MQKQSPIGVFSVVEEDLIILLKFITFSSRDYQTLKVLRYGRIVEWSFLFGWLRFLNFDVRLFVESKIVFPDKVFILLN